MTLKQIEKAIEKKVAKAVAVVKKEGAIVAKRLHQRVKSLEKQVQKHQDKIFKPKKRG